jgi:arginine exporter protein ArgO
MKRLRWEFPERPIPKRPYRDSALVYAGLAGVVVLIAVATGGGLVRAVVVAGVVFVLATGFSWWRWHVRLRRKAEKQ